MKSSVPVKTEKEILALAGLYDAPELVFDEQRAAGPDERIYFLHDKEGEKYCLWVRDYMGELEDEAKGLWKNLGVHVFEWKKLKKTDTRLYTEGGDTYALAAIA